MLNLSHTFNIRISVLTSFWNLFCLRCLEISINFGLIPPLFFLHRNTVIRQRVKCVSRRLRFSRGPKFKIGPPFSHQRNPFPCLRLTYRHSTKKSIIFLLLICAHRSIQWSYVLGFSLGGLLCSSSETMCPISPICLSRMLPNQSATNEIRLLLSNWNWTVVAARFVCAVRV